MASLLQLDIEELHKVSDALSNASTEISNIKASDAAQGIDSALPGSGLDGVCTQAGQFTDGAYQRVAGKLTQVSNAIGQCAKTVHDTDTAFADAMRRFDIHQAGSR
ncbi:hypothetical protein [Nocardia sp. NBC_00511]|uniref:hypothetical protein n=1 Tax=Nocardia sp. NBC_00511 TaxID=2903591 RepID=UPI0030DE8509